jgi:hypothetical protein
MKNRKFGALLTQIQEQRLQDNCIQKAPALTAAREKIMVGERPTRIKNPAFA